MGLKKLSNKVWNYFVGTRYVPIQYNDWELKVFNNRNIVSEEIHENKDFKLILNTIADLNSDDKERLCSLIVGGELVHSNSPKDRQQRLISFLQGNNRLDLTFREMCLVVTYLLERNIGDVYIYENKRKTLFQTDDAITMFEYNRIIKNKKS